MTTTERYLPEGARWNLLDAAVLAENLAKDEPDDDVRSAAFDAACHIRVLLAKFPLPPRVIDPPF